MLSLRDIQDAAGRIGPFVARTPVLSSPALDERAGRSVWLKVESQQITGSFKLRGATNALASLSPEQRANGVVTYSSGNHAQGIARAARLHDVPATIVMPHDAPALKRAAAEKDGATIVGYDRYQGDRAAIAEDLAATTGATIVPPFDYYPVMAGQGTVALELLDEVPDLTGFVAPVGGGGLLAGCATVVAALQPDTTIIGVEPAAGDDHRRSRQAGERVDIGVPETIADGQQINIPGALTWPINNRLVADFVTVTDDEIVETMRLLYTATGLVVEPSGATALAAVLQRELDLGERVGVVLSGGNITADRFAELTGEAPPR